MIQTNAQAIHFISSNIVLIGLLLVFIIRIVPPETVGLWKYKNDKESDGRSPRITILNFVLINLFDTIIRSFVIPLIAAFGLKNMVTLVIFTVVTFDVFIRHQISTQAVTLIGIGIIALYLDGLLVTGKRIVLFGLLRWERKEDPVLVVPSGKSKT